MEYKDIIKRIFKYQGVDIELMQYKSHKIKLVRARQISMYLGHWFFYDKKRGNKQKLEKKWNSLTDMERLSVMEYIPRYIESQPDKAFRKDPETFLNNKSWNDEIILKNHGANKKLGGATDEQIAGIIARQFGSDSTERN